jgi:hypothetical protein
MKKIGIFAIILAAAYLLPTRSMGHPNKQLSDKSISVTDYGAKPNSPEDQTKAIQAAIDAGLNGKIKIIFFPPGNYMVSSVSIGAGLTLLGYNATITMLPHQGKFNRLFDSEKKPYTYNGTEDSAPLVIKGFTFNGNRLAQGPYKHYELEHQSLLFLTADPASIGRMKVDIEDDHFNDSASDGLSLFRNVKATVKDVTAENDFRGGIMIGGGNDIIDIDNYVSTGNDEATGLHSEPGSGNFGPNIVNVNNLNLQKNFTILVLAGSKFTGKNITAGAPWSVSCLDSSEVVISDSRLGGGTADKQISNIVRPSNVQFNNVDFYADDLTSAPGGGKEYVIRVLMNNKWSTYANQKLKFNNCRMHYPQKGKTRWAISGIYVPGEQRSMNNTVTMKDITSDAGLEIVPAESRQNVQTDR